MPKTKKTYFVEADVTFRLKLMVDYVNSEFQFYKRLERGQWDFQHMNQENDFTDIKKVSNISIKEVIDEE